MESLFARLGREWDRFVAEPAVVAGLAEVCALAAVGSATDFVAQRPRRLRPRLERVAGRSGPFR